MTTRVNTCAVCGEILSPVLEDTEADFCPICAREMLAELRETGSVLVDPLDDGTDPALLRDERHPQEARSELLRAERDYLGGSRRSECLSDWERNPGMGGRRL